MAGGKDRNDDISPAIAEAAYKTRLGHLKRAQEHSGKGEVSKAVEHYLTYLKALSMYFGIEESKLSPKLFDPKNIAEQLLISQVYWDLAKAYDRNPKTIKEANRCLNQFVKFSVGFKYQRVNADTVRKYLRKNQCRNPEIFRETYERIRVTSKACYIATHCYGEDNYRLTILRDFRDDIEKTVTGKLLVETYYTFSPKFIAIISKFPQIDRRFQAFVFKPFIELIIRLITKQRHNEQNKNTRS